MYQAGRQSNGSKPGNRGKIVGIQLSGPYPDICYKLIMPDYGITIIGSVLAEKGYDVAIFIEHVEPPDWDAIAGCDLVMMSTFSAATQRTYDLADKIRSELNIPVVMGGTHATYFTADCLKHCDVVVLGEGDETVVEVAKTLLSGGTLGDIAGIAFRDNGRVQRTRERAGPKAFDTIQNYRLIRGFRRFKWPDILRRSRIPLLTAQSSRGCPFPAVSASWTPCLTGIGAGVSKASSKTSKTSAPTAENSCLWTTISERMLPIPSVC